MTERERLIELIEAGTRLAYDRSLEEVKRIVTEKHHFNSATDRTVSISEMVADFLLENGVVSLPCKIGDYCKISKQLTADNSGEGEIKIRYSAIETAQLIGIACVTVNENGTQIMDIRNVFAIKESEDNA